MTNVVHHGSVLGLALSHIFDGNVGSGIEGTFSKFAKDTLRGNLDRLESLVHSSGSLTRPNARFCIWIGEMPGTSPVWAEIGLQTALQRRT